MKNQTSFQRALPKEMAHVVRALMKQGFEFRVTGGGHLRIDAPDGGMTHTGISPKNGSYQAKQLARWANRHGGNV